MVHHLCRFDLVVNNSTESETFYKNIFYTWTFSPSPVVPGMNAGSRIITVTAPPHGEMFSPAHPSPQFIPFIEVPDIDATIAAVQAYATQPPPIPTGPVTPITPGVVRHKAAHPGGGGNYAVIRDVNGILLYIYQPSGDGGDGSP